MYKRTIEGIKETELPKETSMCKAQFGTAMYSSDVAFTITSEVNSSGAYCLVEVMENKEIEPKILNPKRTEYGKSIRKEYELGNIQEGRHNMTELETRNDGVSNTMTTETKDNLVIESSLKVVQATEQGYVEVEPGGVFDGSYPNSTTRRGRVQDGGRVSPALTSQGEPPYNYTLDYRIRKLTPRECFRLMGVSDEDIDKIQAAGISNSQQYKMAGNSIVVDVLFHIFRKMFVETECESGQLSLF